MAFEQISRSICSCNYCGETLEVRDWSQYCPACHAKESLVFVRGIEPNRAALDSIADAVAAITCESCNTQLNANSVDAYFTPALCDDCNMDRAIALDMEARA